jgi:hypothetical protein
MYIAEMEIFSFRFLLLLVNTTGFGFE